MDKNFGDTITIKTYQYLENQILNKLSIQTYAYIVCDEYHYFYIDSWNNKTDISLDWIKSQNVVRIFMSATSDDIQTEIKELGDSITYSLEPNYSYIKNIIFYDNETYIDRVIENLIEDEKILVFGRSTKKVFSIFEKYKDRASFVCSEDTPHKEYKSYIDKQPIVNEVLKNQIVFSTSVMDNGLNIRDAQLKHIIIDFEDVFQVVQAIGRKRVGRIIDGKYVLSEDDNVTLHVRNWSKQNLTQFTNPIQATIREVELLLDRDERYIEELNNKRNQTINACFYCDWCGGKLELNPIKYKALKAKVKRLRDAMARGFDNLTIEFLGDTFSGNIEYINIKMGKEQNRINELSKYLEENIGTVFLDKESRQDMIMKFNLIDGNHSKIKQGKFKYFQSAKIINSYLEENNLPYFIYQFETSRIVEGKKKKYSNAWRITKE